VERAIRFVTLGCCALLVLAIVGCSNPYQEKVIGTWDTTLPFNPKLTLNKDGSGSMAVSVPGQTVTKQLRWRLNGSNLILTVDGKDMGGVIKSADDQKIILNDPDVKQDFTFTRVKG
jgi:hypothetical protein